MKKLTDEQVRQARRFVEMGMPFEGVAEIFEVSAQTVRRANAKCKGIQKARAKVAQVARKQR